jgi:7-cyano-7-deazaguanine reductase
MASNPGTPTQLGQHVPMPQSPEEAQLERVPNPHSGTNYVARFTSPEFTSLSSFRNHGAFHEDCTVRIAKDLADLLQPKWLRIGGYWYPRGGIPIDVFWQTGEVPAGTWVPDQGVPGYRGRG